VRTDAFVDLVQRASSEFADVLGRSENPTRETHESEVPWLLRSGGVEPSGGESPSPADDDDEAPRIEEDEEDKSDWQPLLDSLRDGGEPYAPGQGGGGQPGGKPACRVKRWAYPYFWSPEPPSGAKTSNRRGVGFYFEAEVEFENDPPQYLCSCCVFRQFIRATVGASSEPAAGWRRDKDENDREYGGARVDGSTGSSPDAPEREHGDYSADGCILSFDDMPRKRGQLASGALELTWDFVGLVYDRCNNWAFVDGRRFLFWRRVMLAEDEEGDMVVTDAEGSPVLHKDVAPEAGASAWSHNSLGGRGRMPGSNFPAPPKSEAKRMLERMRRRRVGG
jgi:hypothetical protein